ncbi:MAG: hypothetical protein PHV47_02785 [Candidatus Pacebacteria bacterium]|nr:hypothetical protein [Candidatus Paceibacterota bacterium]
MALRDSGWLDRLEENTFYAAEAVEGITSGPHVLVFVEMHLRYVFPLTSEVQEDIRALREQISLALQYGVTEFSIRLVLVPRNRWI